jgi:hypothetical protein
MQSGAKRSFIILAGTILLAAMVAGCGSSDISKEISSVITERHSDDVNRYLIEKMSANQVLLLADNAHGQWLPRQTVMEFLETWFQTVSGDSFSVNTHHNLVLVLEADSVGLAKELRYAASHNLEEILHAPAMCSGKFTTASMEFFWRLGDLITRIETYNSTQEQSARITFTLFPGEPMIDTENWSFKKRGHYFVYERDEKIAKRIANFAELHPDYKIIGFYGTAHLQRGEVLKQADEDSAQGLFLASYLDSLIGGGVITVGQIPPDYLGGYRNLFALNGEKYIYPTKHSNPEIQKMLAGSFSYDLVIVHSRQYLSGTPILQIPSMNAARRAITAMPDIMNTSNDFNKTYWSPLLKYLNAVSGNSPHAFRRKDSAVLEQEYLIWDKWLKGAVENIVPDLENLHLWQRLIDSLELAQGSRVAYFEEVIISLLPNAPPLNDYYDLPAPAKRAAELRTYLTANQTNIIIDNLIGLLWVGNDLERRMAEEALRKIADTSFSSPAQWSEWKRDRDYFPTLREAVSH